VQRVHHFQNVGYVNLGLGHGGGITTEKAGAAVKNTHRAYERSCVTTEDHCSRWESLIESFVQQLTADEKSSA
jgi:hypothetical protein